MACSYHESVFFRVLDVPEVEDYIRGVAQSQDAVVVSDTKRIGANGRS